MMERKSNGVESSDFGELLGVEDFLGQRISDDPDLVEELVGVARRIRDLGTMIRQAIQLPPGNTDIFKCPII